ncbi:MAG: hypothetical protein ACRC33_22660 [Gemmataceae bacterium]
MQTLATRTNSLTKLRSSNATDSAFPSRPATVTEPASAGVINLAGEGGIVSNNLLLIPFGAGSDNTTFDMQVIGWRKLGTSGLWVPTILGQFSCTLSAAVGVDGYEVDDTERLADTVTSGIGNTNVDQIVTSPANDTPASILIDVKGCRKVEVVFDMTGATSGNALHTVL